MTTKQKLEKLKEFSNEAEFREFLIDLLKKMGFIDVLHTHRYGSPELGKDIIARYRHPLDEWDWYSFIVKKGRIGGGTVEVETIKGQISQSFEYPYKGLNGEKILINKAKVVTNENFTGGAQSSISDSPKLAAYRNFSFWWNESLIPLIDKDYSDFWLEGDKFLKEYGRNVNIKLSQEFELREFSLRALTDEKVNKVVNIFIKPRLHEFIYKDQKGTFEDQKIELKNLKLEKDNFVLRGDPGAGKTKILNNLICDLSSPEAITITKEVPVKIAISKLRNNEFNLYDCIKQELLDNSYTFYDDEVLNKYTFLIVLDSIDQLSNGESSLLIEQINSILNLGGFRFIFSQRKKDTKIYNDLSQVVREVKISNFNLSQVNDFVSRYFGGSERGERFISVLKNSNILSKLPTTPLTITLLSILYDENSYEIPATITDLYDDFVSVILGKLEVRSKGELLILTTKRRLFSHLALRMLDDKNFEIPFDEYRQIVNDFLISKGYTVQTDEQLVSFIDSSGILFVDGSDIVGFKQMPFLEFMASIEIYHHKRETHYKKLLKYFNDVNWQNAAIFYAGRSKDIPGMINDLLKNMPNDNVRDWLINTGGMGYISQALFQTDPEERKKLVYKGLDNMISAFYEMKELSQTTGTFYSGRSLPFIGVVLTYWFTENYKSITLKSILIEIYNELQEKYQNAKVNDFDGDFKMLLVASTLMNEYLRHDESFSNLLTRNSFIQNPLLVVLGRAMINLNKVTGKRKELSDKISKKVRKKRAFIRGLLDNPAYQYNEEYELQKDEK